MSVQELTWILIIGIVCMGVGINLGVLLMSGMHMASPDEESNGKKEPN